MTTMTPVSGSSNFEFSFTVDTPTLKVGEVATATIALTNVVDPTDFVLSLGACYATPESDATSPKYDLLNCNGCALKGPADDKDNMTKVITNKDETLSFSFTAFKWAVYGTRQVLFLHCDVNVCQKSLSTCSTTIACPGTCRRAMRFRREIPNKTNRVTFGPISVLSSEKTKTVF